MFLTVLSGLGWQHLAPIFTISISIIPKRMKNSNPMVHNTSIDARIRLRRLITKLLKVARGKYEIVNKNGNWTSRKGRGAQAWDSCDTREQTGAVTDGKKRSIFDTRDLLTGRTLQDKNLTA